MSNKKKEVSPYTILNRWLYDGSKQTSIPEELVKSKAISQNVLLYFFQQSHYGLYISEVFNNFGIYQLDRLDVFRFLKYCILMSGYKPRYIPRTNNTRTKFLKILKKKFPFLKDYEISELINHIDQMKEKDAIYESVGLYTPKKGKPTKSDLKQLEKIVAGKITLTKLMENFEL